MSPLENWSRAHLVTEKNEATVAFLLSGDASYITGTVFLSSMGISELEKGDEVFAAKKKSKR